MFPTLEATELRILDSGSIQWILDPLNGSTDPLNGSGIRDHELGTMDETSYVKHVLLGF